MVSAASARSSGASAASASSSAAHSTSASRWTGGLGPVQAKVAMPVPPLTVVNDSGHDVELTGERLPASVQLRAELAGQLTPFEAAFAKDDPLRYVLPPGASVTLTVAERTAVNTILSVPLTLSSAVGPWREDCFWVLRPTASGGASPVKASLAWYSRVAPANLRWDRRAHQLTITD